MKTQENLSAPNPDTQELIKLNGKQVWIDRELIPLVKELNKVGLITRSHCSGHGKQNAWIVIRTDTIREVVVLTEHPYNEVRISWELQENNQ